MPSPYGRRRGVAAYYKYGGERMNHAFRWVGMPAPALRSPDGLTGLLDVDVRAHWQQAVGSYEYQAYPISNTDTVSARHAGREQTHIYDMRPGLGLVVEALASPALPWLAAAAFGYLWWRGRHA